jgi:hypothetical protein
MPFALFALFKGTISRGYRSYDFNINPFLYRQWVHRIKLFRIKEVTETFVLLDASPMSKTILNVLIIHTVNLVPAQSVMGHTLCKISLTITVL